MSDRRITPGCLCIILGHEEKINGSFCIALEYHGDVRCECGCNRIAPDVWSVDMCHGTFTDHAGRTGGRILVQQLYLHPIPGDMSPPELLQQRKPVPEIIGD